MALDNSLASSLDLPTRFGLGQFVPNNRSIAGIPADVWIEEEETDEVTFTEHPVEQGAPITDHAFKRPVEVVVRCGWNIQNTGDLSATSGIYGILLNWQASFVLFDLYTGKRVHRNMGIAGLHVITDQTSEYALMAVLRCREVILTRTQTDQAAFSSNTVSQADPSSNSPVSDLGVKSATSPTDAAVGAVSGALLF